jgi:hypothetical protein
MTMTYDPSAARPAEDVAAGILRVTINGAEKLLPVLRIRAEREWKAGLRDVFSRKLPDLEDGKPVGLERLGEFSNLTVDAVLDVVVSYDTTNALGGRDYLEEHALQAELMTVLRLIWAVVFPFTQAPPLTGPAAGAPAPAEPSTESSSTNGPSPAGASIPTDSSGG